MGRRNDGARNTRAHAVTLALRTRTGPTVLYYGPGVRKGEVGTLIEMRDGKLWQRNARVRWDDERIGWVDSDYLNVLDE